MTELALGVQRWSLKELIGLTQITQLQDILILHDILQAENRAIQAILVTLNGYMHGSEA